MIVLENDVVEPDVVTITDHMESHCFLEQFRKRHFIYFFLQVANLILLNAKLFFEVDFFHDFRISF